jgi:hypothetical protein
MCAECGPDSACWFVCITVLCMPNYSFCQAICCVAAQWECISCGGCGSPACYDFQDCWDCPACNC